MRGINIKVRHWICSIISIILMAASNFTYATFITNNDIEMLTVSAPSKWKVYNLLQLFDGIDNRYTDTRFAAYQNKGKSLSDTSVLSVSLLLSQDFNVDSLAFFNDWRHHLNQQVSAMDIALYDAHDRLLWRDDFTNLRQDSWLKIELAKFETPVFDVRKINFNVTEMQGDHLEIRELLVGTYLSPEVAQSTVSNASVSGVILLFLGGFLATIYRVKRRHF